jgi:hypothetical protein
MLEVRAFSEKCYHYLFLAGFINSAQTVYRNDAFQHGAHIIPKGVLHSTDKENQPL